MSTFQVSFTLKHINTHARNTVPTKPDTIVEINQWQGKLVTKTDMIKICTLGGKNREERTFSFFFSNFSGFSNATKKHRTIITSLFTHYYFPLSLSSARASKGGREGEKEGGRDR